MAAGTDLVLNAALEAQERAQACLKEVNAICERYGCFLDPQVIINSKGIQAKVTVTARPVVPKLEKIIHGPNGGV